MPFINIHRTTKLRGLLLVQEADNTTEFTLYFLKYILNSCLRRHTASNSSKLSGLGSLASRETYSAFFFLLFSHIQSYGF